MKIDNYKEEVILMYGDKYTLKQIGDKYDCNHETVKRRLVEWGVVIRNRGWMLSGTPKAKEHREKLRKHLDRIRPMAIEACKAHNKKHYSGSGNPKWRGGSTTYFKQKVLAKNGRVCKLCGYDKHPEIIEVHHKDHDHKNNSVSNGIPVCPNCHRIEHFKLKTFHTRGGK